MKKLTAGLITSALVIVLGSTTALAVGNGRQAAAGNGLNADSQYSAGCTGTFCESTGYYFTDEDGDGICDHRGTRPNAPAITAAQGRTPGIHRPAPTAGTIRKTARAIRLLAVTAPGRTITASVCITAGSK